MNETRQDQDPTRNFAPVIGFALGALVGGALGLLFAPASGARTRRRIGEATRRVSTDALHSLDEARETVTAAASGLKGDVKAAIEAGREAFRHDGEPHDPRPSSRIVQMINPPPTNKP